METKVQETPVNGTTPELINEHDANENVVIFDVKTDQDPSKEEEFKRLLSENKAADERKRLVKEAILRECPSKDVEETIKRLKLEDVTVGDLDTEIELPACENCHSIIEQDRTVLCPECRISTYCSDTCKDTHREASHWKKCKCLKLSRGNDGVYQVKRSPGNMFGKMCLAKRDIQTNEIIRKEFPLAAITLFTQEQLDKIPSEEVCALFGSRQLIGKMFFPIDSPEVIPSEMIESKEHRAIAQLTSLIAKKYPFIGYADYFHTTIVGSAIETGIIEKIHQWAFTEKTPLARKAVSMIFGSMFINSHLCSPLLTPKHVALGFFPACSMFNHACNANAVMRFSSGKLHVYAIKPIRSGEEITVDYIGGKSCVSGRSERQRLLLIATNFECRCFHCRESMDFVPPSMTIEAFTETEAKLRKLIMVDIRREYEEKNFSKVARMGQRLWDDYESLLKKIPYTLINVTYSICVASIMTSDIQYTHTSATICRMIDYCLFIMNNDAMSSLIDGTRRALMPIIETFACAHLILIFRVYLLMASDSKTEDEAREAMKRCIDNAPETFYLGIEFAQNALKIIYSGPLKLDILFLDMSMNKLARYINVLLEFVASAPSPKSNTNKQ